MRLQIFDNFSILLLGHNYYIKGVDLAIDALLQLPKEMNAHLDIIMGDNVEKNTKIIITKYGKIPNEVSILNPTSDICKMYESHKIFLSASIEEGFSYAINEAYYCGAQVVSSDLPPILEVNLPGVIRFSSGDILSLVNALKRAYEERFNYSNSPSYVEQHLSLDVWANNMLRIFGLID